MKRFPAKFRTSPTSALALALHNDVLVQIGGSVLLLLGD
jgi:hypothetical protein